ncbi:MAG: hypothetical protein M1511_16360 [Deltaproteobacteria bacterium]|nr:hypothetical protein [Deltaproteobacteria bacterium]
MKSICKVKIIMFLTFILVVAPSGLTHGQSVIPLSDTGVIREIIGDRVYMHGKLGAYVLEMINTCSWCENGMNVALFFESFSRASMTPNPNPLQMSAVQLFILRDARDDLF